MSELFNAPYAASNQKALRVALRNKKLADELLKALYDLQVWCQAHGGSITEYVLPLSIVPSTSSQYALSTRNFHKCLTAALHNSKLSGRMLNAIRELQVLASQTPIIDATVIYKNAPFALGVMRALISSVANKKIGKLIQSSLLELQQQMARISSATLTASCDTNGVAGDKMIVGDGTSDFSTLLGAGYTASAGGAEVVGNGVSVALVGGVNDIPAVAAQFDGQVVGMTTDVTIDADVAGVAGNITLVNTYTSAVAAQFVGQVAGMTTDVTIDADVAGVAGNITLTADSISSIAALIAAWNLANPANTVTCSAGDDTQVPTADIALINGADAAGDDVAALIATWNAANPANTVTCSVGDASQIPQADIVLAGGADLIPGTAASFTGTVAVVGSTTISEPLFE